MVKTKKILALVISNVVIVGGILSGCSGTSAPETKGGDQSVEAATDEKNAVKADGDEAFLSMGTSSSGGTFNTLGVALCQVWNDKLPGTSFTAEVTAGSSENCLRVGTDDIQLAFSAASSVYEAVNGIGQFEGKQVEGLRVIANLYPAIIQIPVLKDSGINGIDDIVGKKVNIGEAGSGSESQAMGILDCFGISKSDFNAQQLSHSNASDAVVDEKIDGYIISGSLGQSHQMKAMASGKCKLADLGSDEEIQNVINRLPYYYEYTIPSGTYPNQESDVKTVATGTLLIVNESISDDLVYEITKNLFENVDTLVQSQDIAKEITLESGINVSGLPLHPGAERYYKEKGVLK